MSIPSAAALVTGASRGLGRALATELVLHGRTVLVDARHEAALAEAVASVPGHDASIVPVAGDITDPAHRSELAARAASLGGLDLVVLNAGTLGPSPLPTVERLSLDDLRRTLETNLVAQVGLVQALLPQLRPGATIVAVTSDAAVEAYPSWGAYAAAKAGLEQMLAVLAVERPDLRILRVDPGDLRTRMHQDAFPGEDISDRPEPEVIVPALHALIDGPFPSGRYRASEVPPSQEVGVMAASSVMARRLDLEVPRHLIADAPIEASGGRRDDVRMLVAHRSTGELVHTRARHLAQLLEAGDVLVVNTSPTLPAAVPSADGRLLLHLSTDLGDGRWVVELRQPLRAGSAPHRSPRRLTIELAGGAVADLEVPHRPADERGARLWVARLTTPVPFSAWLAEEGRPIRYGRADRRWPIGAYQTFFAGHPPGDRGLGSAEMPSAARFVTPEVVSELIGAGVDLVPITLHTGVSSLEAGEPPYAERYVVSPSSARRINDAKAAGARIIAVGTTATRAVETDARDGRARPGEGWTELVITPERGLEVVDGLISGWHEPEASHLLLMEAVAGRPLLEASYRAAVAGGYRWHEFGDVHLVLP